MDSIGMTNKKRTSNIQQSDILLDYWYARQDLNNAFGGISAAP
jgi:hypothetical protein